ncbi:MAG: ImmA/IrrE family metallo-endopeptidase [Chloroflexota bacterium]
MIRSALIKRTVSQALADAGIAGPPVDLDRIASREALAIRRKAALPPRVRAQYAADTGEISVTDLDPYLERFPIAHELGHALLEHGDQLCFAEPTAASVPLEEADLGVDYEREANDFAGRLLVPGPWLRKAVADGRSIDEMMAMFMATKSVLLIAIQRERLLARL